MEITLEKHLHNLFTKKWKEDPEAFGAFLKDFRVKMKQDKDSFYNELHIPNYQSTLIETRPNSISLGEAELFARLLSCTSNRELRSNMEIMFYGQNPNIYAR